MPLKWHWTQRQNPGLFIKNQNFGSKDQDKDKDFTIKDMDDDHFTIKDKDCNFVLKDSLKTRTGRKTNNMPWVPMPES